MDFYHTKDGVAFDLMMHSTDYAPGQPKYRGMTIGRSAPWIKLHYGIHDWQMVDGERSTMKVLHILQNNNYIEGFKFLNLRVDIIEELKRIVENEN